MESGGLQFNLLMISEEFGLTTTQMGNLVSVQYLAFILIPLIFGGFGDKYGKKIIIFLFALCFSTGCLAFLLSSGFLLALAGSFLAPFMYGLYWKGVTAAGCWAAKEAVAKALGTGFVEYGLKDIEILTDEKGAPQAYLYRGAQARMARLGALSVFISISHEKGMAMAVAAVE